MFRIVLGNIFSLIAIGCTYVNGTRTKKNEMIIWDIGATVCFTLCNVVLKGYSGIVQNFVGILRNLTALFMPKAKYIGWVLVACGVIFGVYFNNHGFIGLLPVASAFNYSYCVISKNASARKLKMALVINSFAFAIYSVVLFNIVGIISDTVVGFTTLHSYMKGGKK